MDLLFSRYASPFLFIDTVIDARRFSDFVTHFCGVNEEQKEWEYFLHKVFDKSFDDFRESLEPPKPVNFETTIQTSKSILDNFKP